MKNKDFNRFLRRYLRAIIEGKREEFFETVVKKKVMQNKINIEQLERLFFFRFFPKMHYDLIKSMIDGPTQDDKQYSALLISMLEKGWKGHAEVMFDMMHDDGYRTGYLNLIDKSKRSLQDK